MLRALCEKPVFSCEKNILSLGKLNKVGKIAARKKRKLLSDISNESNQVSALVMTVREPTLQASLDSLRAQTHPISDEVVVKSVCPVYKAFNQGLKQIKTQFFIQCDADMILDPDCVEILLRHMGERTCMVLGYLEDSILGTVQAVKLFRTEACKAKSCKDSIASDTDQISDMIRAGWKIQFAKRNQKKFGHAKDVFGKHTPNYEDDGYTFERFRVLGKIVRYRQTYEEFVSCLEQLKRSTHPKANLALVGFCKGIFHEDISDCHIPIKESEDLVNFNQFRKYTGSKNLIFAVCKIPGYSPMENLENFYNEVQKE